MIVRTCEITLAIGFLLIVGSAIAACFYPDMMEVRVAGAGMVLVVAAAIVEGATRQ